MIQDKSTDTQPQNIKAVGLISGGLDSTLAAKVIKNLGFDVYGVYFAMPWGCCDKTKAIEAAQSIGIKFIILQLDERYLEVVRKPKHGYGSMMNPCVDCRIHMFSRAAQYMRHIEASFIFTGEVLNQRPMSQKRHSMRWIEEGAGLNGRLLRPLSAQHLPETEVEKKGIVDRNKLLNLVGRSRQKQYAMAAEMNITEFSPPAGGCLLTDENFARKMTDTLKHGYRNFRETIALKWGRHFRLDKNYKIILGRDEEENINLLRYTHPDDIVMELAKGDGPTLILKGKRPSEHILAKAAGFIQRYSRYKNDAPREMVYWPAKNKNDTGHIIAEVIEEQFILSLRI